VIGYPSGQNEVHHTCGLLTKREINTTGYWPSSFLRVYGPRRRSRSISTQKKERGQYPAILTEQAWLITHMYDVLHTLHFCLVRLVFQEQSNNSDNQKGHRQPYVPIILVYTFNCS